MVRLPETAVFHFRGGTIKGLVAEYTISVDGRTVARAAPVHSTRGGPIVSVRIPIDIKRIEIECRLTDKAGSKPDRTIAAEFEVVASETARRLQLRLPKPGKFADRREFLESITDPLMKGILSNDAYFERVGLERTKAAEDRLGRSIPADLHTLYSVTGIPALYYGRFCAPEEIAPALEKVLDEIKNWGIDLRIQDGDASILKNLAIFFIGEFWNEGEYTACSLDPPHDVYDIVLGYDYLRIERSVRRNGRKLTLRSKLELLIASNRWWSLPLPFIEADLRNNQVIKAFLTCGVDSEPVLRLDFSNDKRA